jgi:hypothetical protein
MLFYAKKKQDKKARDRVRLEKEVGMIVSCAGANRGAGGAINPAGRAAKRGVDAIDRLAEWEGRGAQAAKELDRDFERRELAILGSTCCSIACV